MKKGIGRRIQSLFSYYLIMRNTDSVCRRGQTHFRKF